MTKTRKSALTASGSGLYIHSKTDLIAGIRGNDHAARGRKKGSFDELPLGEVLFRSHRIAQAYLAGSESNFFLQPGAQK
jgi:hypothetical protein